MTETARSAPRGAAGGAEPAPAHAAGRRPAAGEGAERLTLAALLGAVAAAVPERTAVVAGDRRATYAGLLARADRLAAHLAGAGVAPGEPVAVLAHNRLEWLEAFFGALRAGAVPVNVNHRYIESELVHVLADSGSVALVAERALAARLRRAAPALPRLRRLLLLADPAGAAPPGGPAGPAGVEQTGYEDALAAAADHLVPALPAPGREARYLLYTGGTTGRPKGVVWRQCDLFRAALELRPPGAPRAASPEEVAERARARSPRRLLVLGPLMHAAGQWNALGTLFTGGTVVLSTAPAFDAEAAVRLADRERVHAVQVVGDAMARPLAQRLTAVPDRCTDLTTVTSGGTPLTPAVRDLWLAWRPGIAVHDSYGGSETGVCGVAGGGAPRFSVGASVAVLDERLRPLPPGSARVGRIARTGRIPLGYHNDPAGTARTFPVDAEGRRWVLSGDYGTVEADGTVTLLGRGSAVINTAGEKVFAEEVESVVKAHPGVEDAIVVAAPDDLLGQRVTAIVAPAPGGGPDADALRDHCRSRLAGFKVPRSIHFVDRVRRTAVGKQDYRWAAGVARSGRGSARG
ncbi:AMP-binding protein [Streptomonospora nanhaiensis]|uniref:Fatty-acyl-CoA synthase n=1 Tax=Streptomonospora nanhaiensis TaxID=1323731 RepID=A0A853BLW1_9ACTN|nr:AMP-binding protein [Streptomonospora nanhaiensis]MBV2363193.1 AMP-binding protein [Streptomonospora nanhaiensis]MBX9389025.1 AMP-binding protein [Streptomonospora nanhaiensis]NYI95551.1 fatty-acyl-CoA synthase [Streptomonospora nanhaiensis]